MKYDKRYIARFVVEAESPLFLGSGQSTLNTDAIIFKDAFGMPHIPGTSLAGVIRHSIDEELAKSLMGFQERKEGKGSRMKISGGFLHIGKNKVVETLQDFLELPKDFDWTRLNTLPVRQHVAINEKGAAKNGSLFDNEVFYAGAQFIFQIELMGTEADNEEWNNIVTNIQKNGLRVGSGTRNGYGKLKTVGYWEKTFDLKENADEYLAFNPSFNNHSTYNKIDAHREATYELKLDPEDFVMFGSGYGDDEADAKYITEDTITYANGKLEFKPTPEILLPGSSIKGAIAHRTCFHYNKLKGYFAGNPEATTAENSPAVHALFGKKKSKGKNDDSAAGKVFINDVFLSNEIKDKIFNHVAIDRFTGGAIQGALFSEKALYLKGQQITLFIDVEPLDEKGEENEIYLQAFENALEDITKGLLPLGGMTTKGYGMFTGELKKSTTKKESHVLQENN